MRLLVSDRESVQSGLCVASRFILISIADSRRRAARVRPQTGLVDVLRLHFDDAEPSESLQLPPSVRLMTPAQARAVWRFVERHRDRVGAIVVQCEQGMSRSPAVAAALARHLGLAEARFWEDHQPNRFVFELMLRSRPPLRAQITTAA